jgi:drug/metabolite transporter (DMT)-like permease
MSRLLYLEPVVSVLGAMVFLGERVTAAVLAGGVLVIAGVLMTGDSASGSFVNFGRSGNQN